MANEIQYRNHTAYNNGTSAENNIKLSDITPFQHEDLSSGVNKLGKMLVAQSFCEPVAVCNSNNPQNGAYVATCQNYPDFALSYQDAQQNTQYLIGLKIRVIFTHGITYGSVSGGTYPTLNINGSGAIPMLAQGKTMATGSASAGQTLEFTVIPYGNGIAFDADSNVRESTSDYTIYTDGSKILPENKVDEVIYDVSITDCNNAFEVGKTKTYWLNDNIPNVPNSNCGWYITSHCNSSSISGNRYITQIATVGDNRNLNYMFVRHKHLGGWTAWKEL